MINFKDEWLTLPGPSSSCPGLGSEDGNLETVVDHDVLDEEDNSENIHDLEMMDDHGKGH